MKANEFVEKFGLKLAQRDIAALDSGFIKREDFLEHYGFDILDDLKRLIESHELIELTGGLEMAKSVLDIEINAKHYEYDASKVTQLSKAIADVESCQ